MPQSPPPAFHWPSRRERVLELAQRLSRDLDAIDLDEVDGEFYWRICRDDLVEQLARLAAELAPNAAEGRTAIDEVFQDLPYDSPERGAFFEGTRPIREAMPPHVWARLVHPRPHLDQRSPADPRRAVSPMPIALRPTRFDFNEASTAMMISVFSRVWSGADLEAELSWQRSALREWFAQGAAERVSLRIEFALMREPPTDRLLPPGLHPIPFVEVVLFHPLPPAGVVGREYDAIVREQRRWHLELPGSVTKQEKEVALRTWAVALLAAGGERYTDAQNAVASRTGLVEVGQVRFTQARLKLIERVPEPAPYLYVRDSWS
jgi:hypothetical protein